MDESGIAVPLSVTDNSVHRLVDIWQERNGEWSGECACGSIFKHMKFGPVVYYCAV